MTRRQFMVVIRIKISMLYECLHMYVIVRARANCVYKLDEVLLNTFVDMKNVS